LFIVALVAISAFPEDIERIRVLSLGGYQIVVVDLIYFCLLISAFRAIGSGHSWDVGLSSRLYIFFLGWLSICVILGLFKFGYRALGESRYVLPFVGYFLPYSLNPDRDSNSDRDIVRLLTTTVVICGLISFIMFWIEVAHGGRFFISVANQAEFGSPEDFRGMRYLGSSQTFNIMALAAFLAVRALCSRKISFLHLASTVILILIAILTKNRAGLFSITVGFLVLLVCRGNIRQLLLFVTCGLLIGVTIAAYSSDAFENATLAIESGLNPTEDETGIWRLALNGAALEQGMETPLVGQGFGGYFYFVVPGMEPIEAPPHNQFVYLFLKTGFMGALLCFLILATFFKKTLHRVRFPLSEEAATIHSWLLVIVVSQLVYGLVYGFVPLFGFFVGCGTILQRVSHTDGNTYRQVTRPTV